MPYEMLHTYVAEPHSFVFDLPIFFLLAFHINQLITIATIYF